MLVNNAGTVWAAPFSDFPVAAFDKVMTLNVRAIFNLTQQVCPGYEGGSGGVGVYWGGGGLAPPSYPGSNTLVPPL